MSALSNNNAGKTDKYSGSNNTLEVTFATVVTVVTLGTVVTVVTKNVVTKIL